MTVKCDWLRSKRMRSSVGLMEGALMIIVIESWDGEIREAGEVLARMSVWEAVWRHAWSAETFLKEFLYGWTRFQTAGSAEVIWWNEVASWKLVEKIRNNRRRKAVTLGSVLVCFRRYRPKHNKILQYYWENLPQHHKVREWLRRMTEPTKPERTAFAFKIPVNTRSFSFSFIEEKNNSKAWKAETEV